MTLILVDKEDSGGLLNPIPNSVDGLNNLPAHNTTSFSPRAVGTQTGAKIITKDSKIIGFDGSNNIGLFGFDDAGNIVVKVAKTGFDANVATNDQLIFNSQQDVFKIELNNTASLVGKNMTAGETKTVPIAHGLSTTPAFQIYVNAPSVIGLQGGSGLTNLPLIYAAGGTIGLILQARVDSTNLYLDLINVGATTVDYSAYTWSFKYYLLQETAT